MTAANESTAPVLLLPNPVWRSYTGGSALRTFRDAPGTLDDHFPEDWLASSVRARNGAFSQKPDEGLSRVQCARGQRVLAELFQAQPQFWFGSAAARADACSTGVLWKLLDSSVRLQIQAHPDRAYARQHLNSDAGKTECWYILGTRGPAHVYLGFQRPPARADWARMIREQRVEEMLSCFDAIPVKPGECYVVPAGTPHAIGEGVFMMELQEPTDWVVRCETVNAGLRLPPEACFMGLDLERCLDVFDYSAMPVEEVRTRLQQAPRVVTCEKSFRDEEVIGAEHHGFFRLHRLRGNGDARWAGGELMLLVVVAGRARVQAGADAREMRAGETWLLPGFVAEWKLSAAGDWEILLAKLPLAGGDA